MNKPFGVADRKKVVPLNRSRAHEFVHRQQPDRPIVRIHLLGSLRATTYLGADALPRGKKARALLGYLCLSGGDRIPRARLATLLWDRVPDAQARTSFRQALREVTFALGPLAPELVLANRDTVRFETSLCWIDAVAVLAPKEPSSDSLRSDLAALCAGGLLEELEGITASFDQWLLAERARFTDRLRTLLEADLHQVARSGNDVEQLASLARRLIAFDPTHEGATRVLMRALVDMGERAQALREYARCREALNRCLDVEPSSETHALYEAIRSFAGREDRDKASPVVGAPQQVTTAPPLLPSRPRLRVGVLPFLGSRSLNENNLAFSLSQEIAAALARFRWFDVIAPVSLMHRQSASGVSEDQLQRKQLDYVVDGAITSNGNQYQISVRLLDLSTYARPVWNDRFELAVGQLHQLNDMVTTLIVGRIDPVILFIEGKPRRREQYGATGLILLAIPLIYSMERGKFEQAGKLIDRALEIEPDNAMVLAWAAHWRLFHAGQGWTNDVAGTLASAEALSVKAIRIDPENAEALGIYAHGCALKKDFDSAIHNFDRALRLNPSLAFIWALSAATFCYVGEPDIALQRLERFRDLAPFDPYYSFFESAYTVAYAFKGEYERAATIGSRLVKMHPDYINGYKPLIAALGHLGRRAEAKLYLDKLLTLEPSFSVKRFGELYPFKRDSDRSRYLAGLRLAGVPEEPLGGQPGGTE